MSKRHRIAIEAHRRTLEREAAAARLAAIQEAVTDQADRLALVVDVLVAADGKEA